MGHGAVRATHLLYFFLCALRGLRASTPTTSALWVTEVAPLIKSCILPHISLANAKCHGIMANVSLRGAGFQQEEKTCKAGSFNPISTMSQFYASVSRCAAPGYRIRTIRPDHITWSPAPAPADTSQPNDNDSTSSSLPVSPQESQGGHGRDGHSAGVEEETDKTDYGTTDLPQKEPLSPAPVPISEYLAFLLVLKHDPFSDQMNAITQAVAPAFPQVHFVKGDGAQFTLFAAQYNVRSYPRLLFFKDGILQATFRGRQKTTSALVAFMTNQTSGSLPKAFVPRDVTYSGHGFDIDWFSYFGGESIRNIYDKSFKDVNYPWQWNPPQVSERIHQSDVMHATTSEREKTTSSDLSKEREVQKSNETSARRNQKQKNRNRNRNRQRRRLVEYIKKNFDEAWAGAAANESLKSAYNKRNNKQQQQGKTRNLFSNWRERAILDDRDLDSYHQAFGHHFRHVAQTYSTANRVHNGMNDRERAFLFGGNRYDFITNSKILWLCSQNLSPISALSAAYVVGRAIWLLCSR